MANVHTYLNFAGKTEEAFNFYMKVFGTEPIGDVVHYGDVPMDDWEITDEEKNAIMHITIPITGGHLLMGSDVLEDRVGFKLGTDTISHIVLDLDTKDEADQLFAALSDGANIIQQITDMPWGAYWGNLNDKFGVQWMVNYTPTPQS